MRNACRTSHFTAKQDTLATEGGGLGGAGEFVPKGDFCLCRKLCRKLCRADWLACWDFKFPRLRSSSYDVAGDKGPTKVFPRTFCNPQSSILNPQSSMTSHQSNPNPIGLKARLVTGH